MATQHISTLLGATCYARLATVLRHVGCCWLKFESTTPNLSQHIATRWPNARNMLAPTRLRYVALACCDRLAGALHLARRRPTSKGLFSRCVEIVRRYESFVCLYSLFCWRFSFGNLREFLLVIYLNSF